MAIAQGRLRYADSRMVENIKQFLQYQSYEVMNTNVPAVQVLHKERQNAVELILFCNMPEGNELTKEQYEGILRQVRQAFLSRGYVQITMLSIICTYHMDLIRTFCEIGEFTHWIIDLSRNHLIVFENQATIFGGIREQIERMLAGQLHTIRPEYTETPNPTRREATTAYRAKPTNIRRYYREKTGNKPIWTIILIVVNIIIFALVEWTGDSESSEHLLSWGASYYPAVVGDGQVYRLFMAMFLHAGIEHLVNNMIVLGLIGSRLEQIIGSTRYVILYLVSGLIAGIGSMAYNLILGDYVVAVGASGAIFGALGGITFLVIKYRGQGMDLTPQRLIFFVLISLYSGFRAEQVDNAAHIIGFLAGIMIAFVMDLFMSKRRRKQTRRRR